MLLAGGMTEKEIESLRQIWLAQFTLFISCWTVQPHERLVCLRKQHQLAFPRPQYEDGPTRSRFFLNQLDVSGVNSFVSGVNSFVLSVYQAARHCSPLSLPLLNHLLQCISWLTFAYWQSISCSLFCGSSLFFQIKLLLCGWAAEPLGWRPKNCKLKTNLSGSPFFFFPWIFGSVTDFFQAFK